MKKRKGTKGAISVFLAIILVPCIVISSVFVDLSRVHLSKAMTSSAADLALNALLTNYDADLKEWYGMVASCQEIQNYYQVSSDYFLRTISSQGMSDKEIILLSDYGSKTFENATIYDLLKVEPKSGTSVTVSNVDGTNLSNPSLLKDQIVEFMKYRAPIQIAEDLFSIIQDADGKTSKEAAALMDNEENEELVEKKQAFFEAEGELTSAAFYSYWAIRDYYTAADKMKLDNAKLQEYQTQINGYKNAYALIHNAVVKNIFNTSSLINANTKEGKVYARVKYPLDKYNATYTKSHKDVYSRKETVEDETVYYIDGGRITSLLNTLGDTIEDFDNAKKAYANAVSSLMSNLPGTSDSQSNNVQWWLQMNNKVNSGNNSHHKKVNDAAIAMLKAYSKVLAIEDCELGKNIPEKWEDRFDDLTGQVSSRQSKYLTGGVTDSKDSYLKAVNKLESVSNSNKKLVKQDGSGVSVTVNGKSLTVKKALSQINTDLSNIKKDLEARIKELDIAIDGDGDKVKSLSELKSLAEKYDTSFENWSDTADSTYKPSGGYTDLAIDDQNEIAGMGLEEKINNASVTELETRLKNIRSQLQKMVDAIDSMKYGNKKLTEIKDVSTFKGETDNQVKSGSIPLQNKEIDNYAGTTFGKLFVPKEAKMVSLSNTTGNSHNPSINPEKSDVDCPELLQYMHDKFKETTRDKFNKVEEDKQGAKDAQAEYEKAQEDELVKGRTYGTNFKREYSSEGGFSAGTGLIKSVIGLFKDIISGNLDGIRDDIFVTSYITNMFSFATFDYEAKYNMLSDEDKKALVPKSATTKYASEEIEGAADKPGTWLSTDVKDSYNKSLTNKMINSANNAAYLSEIEYILYGETDNVKNVKAAFAQIYVFRLALNTVSAFQHFWSMSKTVTGGIIHGVATGISGATLGVIPIPVIKAVLLPILAAVETCMDNQRLAKGMPVEIYKIDADDWWISVPGGSSGYTAFFNSLKDGEIKPGKNQDEGIFYSDYLTIFVYCALSGGGKMEENAYKRTAEVIQANMRKVGAGNSYSMKLSRVYFRLKATIQVKPLMINMPIFNEYENNMDTKTDWCTYEIDTVRGYN